MSCLFIAALCFFTSSCCFHTGADLACRHYIENTSKTEDLVWIEIYKSDRVADISLTQWLALTNPGMAAQILKVDVSVINQLKKEKQLLIL